MPPVWQSLLDQYVSDPLVIVSTCCAEPRSIWHAALPELVIDIAIFGSSVGPNDAAFTIGFSTIWPVAHAAAGAADAAADATAEGALLALGGAAAADADGLLPGAAVAVVAVEAPLAAPPPLAFAPDPAPCRWAAADADAAASGDAEAPPRPNTMSSTTTITSTAAAPNSARRRQYTDGRSGPTG